MDLPTGWDADSTAICAQDAFRSDAGIAFTAAKLAHVFGALTRGPVAVRRSARLRISPCRILTCTGPALQKKSSSSRVLSTPTRVGFGHVLVVGGSPGKGGAAAMASLAAMRAGAGLTTAAIPRGIASIVAGFAPEMMTLLLDDSSTGGISISNIDPSKMEKMRRGITTLAMRTRSWPRARDRRVRPRTGASFRSSDRA